MKHHDLHASKDAEPKQTEQQLRGGSISEVLHASPRQVAQAKQLQALFQGGEHDEPAAPDAVQLRSAPPQRNDTGMPDFLKTNIEAMSGIDLSDVRVHRNSHKPAQLNAFAYAQGSEIHLGAGQEHHLPHEAWHVVQQRQGRVAATAQMRGVGINDDAALEAEADRQGALAAACPAQGDVHSLKKASAVAGAVQLAIVYQKDIFGFLPHWEVVARGMDDNGTKERDVLWQVGFANPIRFGDTLESVGTKSGSPSGWGGEGEVRWTKLRDGAASKGGYTEIARSHDDEHDQLLLDASPRNGERRPYRLTSKNCQHFVVDAWNAAGLTPDIAPLLTLSKEGGARLNTGLAVGAGLALGAAAWLYSQKT